MTILLLFNEQTSITVEAIINSTQIESELCLQVLLSLLKSKVITCSQITAAQLNQENNENIIHQDYTIDLDQNFRRLGEIYHV